MWGICAAIPSILLPWQTSLIDHGTPPLSEQAQHANLPPCVLLAVTPVK